MLNKGDVVSNDYGGIGETINAMYYFCVVSLVVFVPLGTWKLIEIIIWLIHHIKVS
jgi:hypothetical protein